MAISMPANANSAANISPVGPPPTITTACLVFAAPISSLRRNWLRPAFYGMPGVLKQAPCALHISVGRLVFCFPVISAVERNVAKMVLALWRETDLPGRSFYASNYIRLLALSGPAKRSDDLRSLRRSRLRTPNTLSRLANINCCLWLFSTKNCDMRFFTCREGAICGMWRLKYNQKWFAP